MLSLANVQSRMRAHTNLVVVVGIALLGGLKQSMIGVVWQPFVLSLGASMSVLGLLASIGGANGIVTTLVSPFAGWFADRRGRKAPLIAGSLLTAAAFLLYTLAGLTMFSWLLLPGIMLLGLAAVDRPANSALIGESVSAARRTVSRFSPVWYRGFSRRCSRIWSALRLYNC